MKKTLLISLKNEGETNFFSVRKSPGKSIYREYIKAKAFCFGVAFLFLWILNSSILFVYVINGWAVSHIFNNESFVFYVKGIFIKSNRVFSLATERFVCFEKKGQGLIISLQRTKVNWRRYLLPSHDIFKKLIFFSDYEI